MSAREHPAPFVTSSGTLLFDADGADYLDATGSAQSVGHGNARVTDAIATSAASLGVSSPDTRAHGSDYAEDLLSTFPDALDEIRFACSASEANDLAIRVARSITGGRGMIVSRNAYHGVTTETSAISPAIGGSATVPGWIRVVDAPTDSAAFSASVATAARDLSESEYGLCALVVDPVFASDGVVVGAPLADAAQAVRASGGVVIADEVQSGFGRLGTGMWGFQSTGIVPDLVTVGKAMGNGMSIAAVVGGPELAEIAAEDAGYSSSTAGDVVSVAAAQAVLDSIRDGDLMANARSVGDYLLMGLALLASAGDALGEVRGSGLCAAIDVIGHGGAPDSARASALVDELARRRVLVSVTGLHGSVIVVRLPLTCTTVDVDRLLEQLYGAILVVEPTEITAPAVPSDASEESTAPEASDKLAAPDAAEEFAAPDAAEAVTGEPDAEDTDPDPEVEATR